MHSTVRFPNEHTGLRASGAFTLIELLVVITIIAILAGFSFPVLKSVKRTQYIKVATAEMHQLESAIDSYKAAVGFYPPSNPGNPETNQLYYELVGTTNVSTSPQTFETLDGVQSLLGTQITTAFGGVSGFANCSKFKADAETVAARNFIHELSTRQIGSIAANGIAITNFITSVGGPDDNYRPLGQPGVNPWRYVSPGVKNPAGYDLWVELVIGGKTNLVCNWHR